MNLYVLFAQRKCSYPGEYGLEAMHCMTEYEYSDNPEYLSGMKREYSTDSTIDSMEIVKLEVNEQAIKDKLFPPNHIPAIPTEIV